MLSARFFRFFRYLNLTTLRITISRAIKRRLMGLSAEMAYNAILALFPAILAVLTAIGLFEESLQDTFRNLARQVSEVIPLEAMELIRDVANANAINLTKSRSLFSLSFIFAIWVSSGAMSAAMNALDQIHQIPPEQTRPFWKAKLISIGLTLGSLVFLVLASFLVFISDWVIRMVVDQSGVSILLTLWRLLSWPLALGIIAIACAVIYRYGPSRWSPGTPIMPGAILAAISWAIVSALFRLYVTNFGNYNKVYGAVGAVIVLLLWLYMTSLVLLLGEQINVTVGEAMKQPHKRDKLIKSGTENH
jgi:membrane protein